ncbi:MAG TPA: glycerol-3-phosphate 1-O-acyltransferase PlsY [Candidatus Binatia bacterium]|nr:glycerol-3-phosphate 1-O-acyltransferase PlsY [Candidatus Binatia bacterium]
MEILLIVFGYLMGSVPVGFILGSRSGIDVRAVGSGNVGATNVARVVGKRQGILTLIADTAKGFLPVILAMQLGASLAATVLVGAAAFLGHLYPIFLKFKGGKGVATALGVFLAVAPMATLVLVALFACTVLASRIVSLSSILTAVAAPIIFWLFSYPPLVVGMAAFIALAITYRHRSNIRRMMNGSEPRFGSANSQ